jgi:hypothetical protein
MRSGILAGVVTLSVAGFGGLAQANQLLGTFENTVNSSLSTASPFTFSGGVATLNPAPIYSATGATDGASSLRLRLPLSFVFGFTLTEGSDKTALKNAWNANDRLLFDVTIPQINDAAGAPDTDGYVVFLPAVNSDGTGGGFHQSPGNLQIVAGGTGENAYNKGTVTLAWEYRAQGILFPADAPATGPVNFGFTQFNLATNAGGFDAAPVGYFDNFRLVTVPEPTTLAALGSASLLFRRRR